MIDSYDDDACEENSVHANYESNSPADEEPDFENRTGYRNPPKAFRWKRGGPSPNPFGRPPKDKSKRYRLEAIARRPVKITVGGRQQTMDLLEAVLLMVKTKAIENDPKAGALMRKIRGEVEPDDEFPIRKGLLIVEEKYTMEEWEDMFGVAGEA